MKKILFISYGGGHCQMLLPVIQHIKKTHSHIECDVIGLTTAQNFYKQKGLSVYGYKNFFADDKIVQYYGKQLLADNIQPLVSTEESICYLGASYRDLVDQYGKSKAKDIYEKEGRMAFLPLYSMQKIIKTLTPDIIVTTNAPRSELAAVLVGKSMNVPTLSVVDLFGIYEADFIDADIICVPFSYTKNILENRPNNKSRIVITGQPNFQVTQNTKIEQTPNSFLWCDQPAYYSLERKLILRTPETIIQNLDEIYQACAYHNFTLTVRPHPSQNTSLFLEWAQKKGATVGVDNDIKELICRYQIISSISSTVLVEAAIRGKFVIKYHTYDNYNDLPLEEEYGYMRTIRELQNLPELLAKSPWKNMEPEKLIYIKDAAAKIVGEILKLG